MALRYGGDYLSYVNKVPIRLSAGGWETDTLKLQNCGWKIFADYHADRMAVTIGIFNPKSKMTAMEWMESKYIEEWLKGNPQLSLPMTILKADEVSVVHEAGYKPYENMIQVNADPNLVTYPGAISYYDTAKSDRHTPLYDMGMFSPWRGEEGESVIIKPESVPELMDRILALQDPKMKELIAKNRQNEPKITNHCKIISIAS